MPRLTEPRQRRLFPALPLLLAALVFATGVARAQTAPLAPAPPPAQAPTASPPPGEPPSIAAPAGEPPPLALTPAPAQSLPPPLTLDQRAPARPAERPVSFYRKRWFWGTVGLVVVTTAVILFAVAASGESPPTTSLGNMHAF